MATAVVIVAIATLTGLGVLTLLVLVLVAIHDEDRHMSLTSTPRTRTEAVTRRLLGVGIRNPGPCHGTSQPPSGSDPPVTFPGARTGRDMTGHPLASGLVLIMSRPAAPDSGHGSQPAPPRWSRDRSGLWLRNAAAGLCVLAAAAAAVSFTAQYRMAETARHLPAIAALEAAIPDAAALVFASLGIALALHGRRALRARTLNLAAVGTSVFMNVLAAEPGWRNLAIWALPRRGDRPPPAAGYNPGRRRAHPAGHPRRPGPVAAAPGPGPGLHPDRVPRLGPGGLPGRPRPPRPPGLAAAVPAGPGEGNGPEEGDQDRPVPGSGDRTAWVSRLDPARHHRPDRLGPGPPGRPAPRRRPHALRKAVLAARNGDPR